MENVEIRVSCPTCKESFETKAKIGEYEICVLCPDVFIIHSSDVVDES